MELSRPQLDAQESISSIRGMAAMFEEKQGIKEPLGFGYLMSSLRSFVDGGDELPEDLFDEWQDSFIRNVADDDADFNGSMRDLFTSVNDLLLSKATFTLCGCTLLEAEMMRLKKLRRQTNKQEDSKPGFDPLGLGDRHDASSSASDDAAVQRQKEKLANILKDTVGGREEKDFLPTNLRTARHPPKPKSKPKSKKLSKDRPLNPDRFNPKACDPAPRPPSKRSKVPVTVLEGRVPVSPLTPSSVDSVHSAPRIKRWDSGVQSPVKHAHSAPRSPTKRMQRSATSTLPPQLSSIPILDLDDDTDASRGTTSSSGCQQAMVPTVWENGGAPKQPNRIPSRRHLMD